MPSAIIIGSGIGGLGTACLLAKKGWQVTVLEKNEQLGGRAGLLSEGGFRFDMGPSWYLMPDVFAHFYELLGERVEDHLDLRRLDPSYRIFFKDEHRPALDLHSDLAKDSPLLDSLEPGAGAKLKDYLARSAYQYEVAKKRFLYRNADSVFDFFDWKSAVEGAKLSVFSSMDRYVRKFFATDALRKIMEYQLVFLGAPPKRAPALYNIMAHIDFSMGVFYPQGGITKIIRSLEAIGTKHGTTFRTNSPVQRIIVENGAATGVQLESGEILAADAVISNADIQHTEARLLDEAHRDHSADYWATRTLAPSALIIYLGISEKLPRLTHHNLLFAKDWDRNFNEIFDNPKWPTDPSFYVCAPSVTDPSVAPPGKENLFVLVPIAAGLNYDQARLAAYADKILATMEREMDLPGLRQKIIFQKLFCVKDFASRYNSFKGSALGLAHTAMQTAIFRPSNASKKVKNLYYAGGTTVPGIGMPICLVSAELVYKRLTGDRTAGPLTSLHI